ncbi:hypothetical protein [uncultured Thiodictyon sp.]|uniref:hypothetical protein n=1 Tax=uncultured Thiodictyon sp. TaxID=1846217 RepID=UPI0025E10CDC|nr:hypothetical protein [uncultured Thiodictyon sp.]
MTDPARSPRRGIKPAANLSETAFPHAPVRPDSPPEVHPVCLLLPSMGDADLKNLVQDIKTNGQRHRVLLFEGKILDGRHRARACNELGIVPQYEEWSGSDPVAFVLSENLHRRHLDASQRAAVVAAAESYSTREAEAAAREKAGKKHETLTLAPRGARVNETGKAAAVAATTAGVSTRTMERARKIAKQGTPDDVREVIEGKVTVTTKAREIDARKRPPVSQETPAATPVTAGPAPAPEILEPDPADDSVNVPVVLKFTDREWERLRAIGKRSWNGYRVQAIVRAFVLLRLEDEEDRLEERARPAR